MGRIKPSLHARGTQIALLAAIVLCAGAAIAAAAADPLREQIEQRLDRDAAAWNRGDLEAFCASYAEDASFVTAKGITHGRADVLARYRQSYPDRAAMGTLRLELLELRPAPAGAGQAPTALSLIAHWSLTYPDRPEASGSTLLVLHRAPSGDWEIVQDVSL